MANSQFARLLSPLSLGGLRLRNRMIFTAHDSALQKEGLISEAYIAYQVARAKGGAGLQILAAASIDENSSYYDNQLLISSDETIPGFRRLADAVHEAGGTVFGQLLHAGRENSASIDGSRPVTYSASAARTERLHSVPREMTVPEIKAVVRSFGLAAKRAQVAGLDGVEICGSQGNLPSQFLAASINGRTDQYGGSAENRLRFLFEICESIRSEIGPKYPLGLRLSITDFDNAGLEADESIDAMRRLEQANLVDYFHVVLGTGATKGGAMHVVPPMAMAAGYLAPFAERAKRVLNSPLIATGRFNTPQLAESAIQNGQADAVGMTRAMICDPELARKVAGARIDDIRACIACDQACIGHLHKGFHVSCIQYPESGRETSLAIYPAAAVKKRILIAGGGPAGMKAAAVAASRGHHVILCEASARLGGQANDAARILDRAEFGGIVGNLTREVELAGAELRLKTPVTRALVEEIAPDVVIVATGGRSAEIDQERFEGMSVLTAEEALASAKAIGQRVVVADAQCDWVGIGISLQLAINGHDVTLAVPGVQPGDTIPIYVRDGSAARLFKAGVKVINYARLYGADATSVYFEHITALEPIVIEQVDTLVVCDGVRSNRDLEMELAGLDMDVQIIGDCLAPRTAEEAVLDGLKVARLI